MSATTGYFVAGSSWLHRRNPLTKLLGARAHPAAAFLLPPIVLIVPGAGHRRRGLVRPACSRRWRERCGSRRCCCVSILVVNGLFFPGATEVLAAARAAVGHARGPDLRARLGRPDPGRVPGVGASSCSRRWPTTCSKSLDRPRARAIGIAFVVLSAVQMVPRMQARAGSILEAQQARGLPIEGSIRAPAAGAGAAHRAGDPRLARRRPRADLRPRGAGLRGPAGADGLPRRRRSAGRPLASLGLVLAAVSRWSSWP